MNGLTLIFFIVFLTFQVIYIIVSLLSIRKGSIKMKKKEKAMTVLVPAYNEELVLKNCINAMNHMEYSNYEVIIINDGSTDHTMSMLKEHLQLVEVHRNPFKKLKYNKIKSFYQSVAYKNIFVIDKYNGGKADALNAGIDYARKEIIITLDADSMLDRKALKYMSNTFCNKRVIAAGGTVQIVQGIAKGKDRIKPMFPKKSIIRHQVLHYIHGFYIKKQTQSIFNSIVVISGAFGAFQRKLLFEVHGFRSTVGEDMDITLKIYKYLKEQKLNKKLIFVPEAVCYTECPDDMKNFMKQRFRWQQAFIDCVVKYWEDLFKGFSTSLSLFFLVDGFIFGTLSAFIAITIPINILITDHGTDIWLALKMYLLLILLDLTQSIIALILNARYGYKFSFKDYLKIILFLPIDLLIFRQIPLIINTAGSISYFLKEEKWNYIERRGKVTI